MSGEAFGGIYAMPPEVLLEGGYDAHLHEALVHLMDQLPEGDSFVAAVPLINYMAQLSAAQELYRLAEKLATFPPPVREILHALCKHASCDMMHADMLKAINKATEEP